MWRVPADKLKVELLPRFYLMEDETFVYLFCGEKRIAFFHRTVTNQEILKAVADIYRDESKP